MSAALLRRDSSRQGLQALLRVTAQRSVEDAEEVEREQRRRLRDAHRPAAPPEEGVAPTEEGVAPPRPNEEELKAGQTSSLEEDEGFSDGGAQRRERARRRQAGLDSGEEETAWDSSQPRLRRQERQEETEEATDGRAGAGGVAGREQVERERAGSRDLREGEGARPAPSREVEHKKEAKLSQSKGFLQQEVVHSNTNGNTPPQEAASYMNMKTKRPISHQEKENQEQEQLRQRQQEAEQELEVLKRRREERRRAREEEQQRRGEAEELHLAGEEQRRSSLRGPAERRTPAAERGLSSDQEEGVSPGGPRTPTPKTDSGEGREADSSHLISERTESLSRSLKKSNSFKKTQAPVLLSRLDARLEQYANAIETSQQEVRAPRRGSGDLSPSGPLASRRSVFQAGEPPSPSRPAGCKETEGLKVGVANLITQWVKGSPESSGKAAPCRPAEVRPGDVMQKKNMWEGVRDTERTGPTAGDNSGKKFKFVVTGHGKYQKL